MMIRVNQVKCRPGHSMEQLRRKTAGILHVRDSDLLSFSVVRQSIDARKKPEIYYSYTVDVEIRQEDQVLKRVKGNQAVRTEPVVYRFPKAGREPLAGRPVIIGMGPAGLFCGYYLALHGYRPLLLERGAAVEERIRDVEAFWQGGPLKPDSNVQFGEGGAGAFSDGKLNTLVKDRDGRNREVLNALVRFGAKESILYEAKPHLGTDVLCGIVGNMREEIIRLGGEVRFHSQVTDFLLKDGRVAGVEVNGREAVPCSLAVLAIGHSARDTFSMLYERAVEMEAKSFAVGLRVEHPQAMINLSQYGMEEPGELGAASYKVTAKTSVGRGVYSFCMCPGGYVVNASSEPGRLAVNGMSYSGRDGRNANSAVIVSVTPEDFGTDHPLAGIEFQRELEETAYRLGGGKIPVQRYGLFRRCVQSGKTQRELEEEGAESMDLPPADRYSAERTATDGLPAERTATDGYSAERTATDRHPAERTATDGYSAERTATDRHPAERSSTDGFPEDGLLTDQASACSALQPRNKGGYAMADLSRLLPEECGKALVEGMEQFGRQIAGFDREDALLSGVESRTSSPVRIPRGEDFQSSVKGLYPCGEGAGYAGGITSAAMDGLRTAEVIAARFAPLERV